MAFLILFVTCVIAFLFPAVGVGLTALILVLQMTIIFVRFSALPRSGLRPNTVAPAGLPIFSVHVAAHQEPPRMVGKTISALHAQDWPADRYEVVVIDNNTDDPALWRPLQTLCRKLGANVRFLHRVGVVGAKAGALNIALAHTRPDATHIVTVDADYVVDPDFLSHSARALAETGADYVQFPQAYQHRDDKAAGLDAELEEYFRTNARMADGSDAVLLTGTLCVISYPALLAVGGWSGRTTTEDAELGVRLCHRGFVGRFIDRVVGRGYLPLSLRDLERQRHRWASGNLLTLKAHAGPILLGSGQMGWRQRGAILAQLTAWLNLSLVPAALLLTALMVSWGSGWLAFLAAVCIFLSFADIVTRLVWRGLRDGTRAGTITAAICNRLALVPISALATVEALSGRARPFVVTDKTGMAGSRHVSRSAAALGLFVAAALALPAALEAGALPVFALLVLMLPLPAAFATTRTLNGYRATMIPPTAGATP